MPLFVSAALNLLVKIIKEKFYFKSLEFSCLGPDCSIPKSSYSSSSIGKSYANYQSVDVLRKKLNDHISKQVILFV
jgi:hypothetical protein